MDNSCIVTNNLVHGKYQREIERDLIYLSSLSEGVHTLYLFILEDHWQHAVNDSTHTYMVNARFSF